MKTSTIALLVVALGCCTPGGSRSIVPPDPNPSDYPCGVDGQVCPDQKCCDTTDVCGGTDGTCPPGFCCYTGPEPWPAKTVDGGVRMRAAWSPRR